MSALKYNVQSLKDIRQRSNQWLSKRTELLAAKLERLVIACHGYNKIQPIRLSKSAATMAHSKPADGSSSNSRSQADLLRDEQPQFRPCLGSSNRQQQRPCGGRVAAAVLSVAPIPISVMDKYEVRPVQLISHRPTHTTAHHQRRRDPLYPIIPATAAAAADDYELCWGTDLSQMPVRCTPTTAAPLTVAHRRYQPTNCTQLTTVIAAQPKSCGATATAATDYVKCERHRRVDCEAMIAQINRACAVTEHKVRVKTAGAGAGGGGGANGCGQPRRQRKQLLRQHTAPPRFR